MSKDILARVDRFLSKHDNARNLNNKVKATTLRDNGFVGKYSASSARKLSEIEINKPGIQFPLTVSKDEWPRVSEKLYKQGYKWNTSTSLKDWNPWKFHIDDDRKAILTTKYEKYLDWDVEKLNEIKVNKPDNRLEEIEINKPGKIEFPLIVSKNEWSNIAAKLDRLGYERMSGYKFAEIDPWVHGFFNETDKAELIYANLYHDPKCIVVVKYKPDNRLEEIEVNKPGINFPLKVSKDDWFKVAAKLDKHGYIWSTGPIASEYNPWDTDDTMPDEIYLYIWSDKLKSKKMTWRRTPFPKLEEIEVNKPGEIKFPVEVTYQNYDKVIKNLKTHGYIFHNGRYNSFPKKEQIWKNKDINLTVYLNKFPKENKVYWVNKLNEIQVNKPGKSDLTITGLEDTEGLPDGEYNVIWDENEWGENVYTIQNVKTKSVFHFTHNFILAKGYWANNKSNIKINRPLALKEIQVNKPKMKLVAGDQYVVRSLNGKRSYIMVYKGIQPSVPKRPDVQPTTHYRFTVEDKDTLYGHVVYIPEEELSDRVTKWKDSIDEIEVNKPGYLKPIEGKIYWVFSRDHKIKDKFEFIGVSKTSSFTIGNEDVEEYNFRKKQKSGEWLKVSLEAEELTRVKPYKGPIDEIEVNKPGKIKFPIKVENRQELKRVLTKLKNAGYKWRNGDEIKPFEYLGSKIIAFDQIDIQYDPKEKLVLFAGSYLLSEGQRPAEEFRTRYGIDLTGNYNWGGDNPDSVEDYICAYPSAGLERPAKEQYIEAFYEKFCNLNPKFHDIKVNSLQDKYTLILGATSGFNFDDIKYFVGNYDNNRGNLGTKMREMMKQNGLDDLEIEWVPSPKTWEIIKQKFKKPSSSPSLNEVLNAKFSRGF